MVVVIWLCVLCVQVHITTECASSMPAIQLDSSLLDDMLHPLEHGSLLVAIDVHSFGPVSIPHW